MDVARIAGRAAHDMRRGWRAPIGGIVVAALVALPFTGALAILLGGATDLPAPALILVVGALQGVATFWVAGWRARGRA